MTKYILGMLTIIVLFALGYAVGSTFMSEPEEAPKHKAWCEAGYIDANGHLVYSQGHAGETNFIVVATSDGPRLMVECE